MTPAEEVRTAATAIRFIGELAKPEIACFDLVVADLLDHIGDDMDDESAYENYERGGKRQREPIVCERVGDGGISRHDWTAALALARVINDLQCPMCGRHGCEPKHHEPIVTPAERIRDHADCRTRRMNNFGTNDLYGPHTCTEANPCDARP